MSLYQVLYHSTPFQTTTGSDNPRPEGYPPTLGIEMGMTDHLEGAYRPGVEIESQVPGPDG
jgi:hypothetical protein